MYCIKMRHSPFQKYYQHPSHRAREIKKGGCQRLCIQEGSQKSVIISSHVSIPTSVKPPGDKSTILTKVVWQRERLEIE